MPSQLETSSNDLPMRGSMTMQPVSDEWTLVPEEMSGSPKLPVTQEEASDSDSIDSWEMLDEDLNHPNLETTASQSQALSDSSSPASSTLTAPGLVDGCVPPASTSAHSAADSGSSLMTRPSPPPTDLEPDEVDIGPATSSGPGPYIEVAFEAAETSGSEFDSVTFGPGNTNASPFGHEPPQFGSGSAIYSFGPWISPEEFSALFSQGPIFLFFEPELANSRAIASSGATHPTLSDPSPHQSPRSASSSPQTGVSRSLNISSNQVRPGPSHTLGHEPYSAGPETYTYGFRPSPNGPGIYPSASFGPEPSSAMGLTFGPRPTSFNPASSANDHMMGPRPTSNRPGCNNRSPNNGPGPFLFGPGPDGYNPNMGHNQASFGPRTYANGDERKVSRSRVDPAPRAHAYRMGPGQNSFGPGPHVYDTTLGLNPALRNTIRGPGPTSFGPGPHVYVTTPGSKKNTYDSIIGPGPTSFGPVPTMYTPTIGPGPFLDPGTPLITVEHTSVKRDVCKRFFCAPCNKGFDRIEHMARHKATKSHANNLEAEGIPLNPILSPAVHSCPFCDRTFNRQDNLRPHLLRHMDNNGTRSRTRQVSVDESIRMGLAYLDPRLILNLQCRLGKWEVVDE